MDVEYSQYVCDVTVMDKKKKKNLHVFVKEMRKETDIGFRVCGLFLFCFYSFRFTMKVLILLKKKKQARI